MESFEDSNCPSLSDGFSLYSRYMKSFNIVDNFVENNGNFGRNQSSSSCDNSPNSGGGNIDLTDVQVSPAIDDKQDEVIEPECLLQTSRENIDKTSVSLDEYIKIESPCTSLGGSLHETSSAADCLLTDKSDPLEVRMSSDESKQGGFKPVFITSTMENSNNAVDSVPMFRGAKRPESVFKLPNSELSFNGTIKHVQKLKPMVDPIKALNTTKAVLNLAEREEASSDGYNDGYAKTNKSSEQSSSSDTSEDRSSETSRSCKTESSSDSQSEDTSKKGYQRCDEASSKWNLEQSYSSLDGSFDSGVRSPDMFSEEEDQSVPEPEPEPFWNFIKDFEAYDKRKVRKMEETLQGILPPPSVTTLKTDVTQMLDKYYCFLPAFNEDTTIDPEENSMTPTKKVSFIQIPNKSVLSHSHEEIAANVSSKNSSGSGVFKYNHISRNDSSTSINDKSMELKMCTEIEAVEMSWPDVLKCRHHDVYYNVTSHSEKIEMLIQKIRERFVGAETDTSVSIYSGGMQSPSSASKRKAMRLKMAQAKSPGRRLSHLARRRQAFCSAATINEKAQSSTSRMVLIDKKKLVNTCERKSPRLRRTPGKKTPVRRTPGKITPSKTPKTKSGGSSRKKAMRRLLLDNDSLSRSQPSRETSKRALFVSPENRKPIPAMPSSSMPHQAMRSKRALFGSPVRAAETKSMDGTQSDQFMKRKRDMLDDEPENSRSKIAKSLSFGGDTISSSQPLSFNRRVSEMFSRKNTSELNETHKKKLLWAVSEALRVHGWRMSTPGFREKASSLASLTRRLLTLPPHAARLAAPNLSTSDTMLKIARQYVYAIIQGRSVEECYQDEKIKLANEGNKLSGYISASAYQQMKTRQVPATSTLTSQIKENACNDGTVKQDQPRSSSKNILQDKLVNIDTNSNSSSGLSVLDKAGIFMSHSMPSFEEAAKIRARRQISFDNIDFPKR